MKTADILKLLSSPFRRRTLTRKPELPARMLEAGLEEPDRHPIAATGSPSCESGRPPAGSQSPALGTK